MQPALLRCLFLLLVLGGCPSLRALTSVTQYGITWTFDHDYPGGQFVTGDYWVIGPVKVTGITSGLHAPGFAPKPGEDGSMVNPGTDDKQGYDNRISSYKAELNAGLVGGQPVSAAHPLALANGSSLVSMVSWLYRSDTDKEPGTPKFNGHTEAPRPVTKSAAVLTVLAEPPAKDAFRPPYCGSGKGVRYVFSQVDLSRLKNLPPIAGLPTFAEAAKRLERPWIDHVNEFLGAMVHPSFNMPQYGRDIAGALGEASLLVQFDPATLPGGKAARDKVLVGLLQFGIDCAGIADNGGGWPADGGHQVGRKWPILFAGTMLNDAHMKDVGHWKTRFQEDEQTFYVSQPDVDLTNSPKWKPDRRGADPAAPYAKEDIGMPEWGYRHATVPATDNKAWTAPYRSINGMTYAGFVIPMRLMGLEDAWNHKSFFDFTARWMQKTGGKERSAQVPDYVIELWKRYGEGPPAAKP